VNSTICAPPATIAVIDSGEKYGVSIRYRPGPAGRSAGASSPRIGWSPPLAIAPTLKLSANPDACARLAEQIDIVATAALRDAATLDALADAAMAKLCDVASGTLTFGEIVGEGAEVVSRLGPSM